MNERMNNFNTIDAIAERCGVVTILHAQGLATAGDRTLRAQDKTSRTCSARSMVTILDGQTATLENRHPSRLMPPHGLPLLDRTNWAEAGY